MEKVSIIVLTYNRKDRIQRQVKELLSLSYGRLEIVVVDNCSDFLVSEILPEDKRLFCVRNEENLGAVGRNEGIKAASGKILVTLDDDVYGLTDADIGHILDCFSDKAIGAVNFKVLEEGTGRLINWCHPRDSDIYSECQFVTYEISEGAVAFRSRALSDVGLYPYEFFISHEGLDLSLRLINAGWKVIYSPKIEVIHGYELLSRSNWRRYYYDTRNLLWVAVRNMPFVYGVKKVSVGLTAMLIYSIRDGFF